MVRRKSISIRYMSIHFLFVLVRKKKVIFHNVFEALRKAPADEPEAKEEYRSSFTWKRTLSRNFTHLTRRFSPLSRNDG